MRLASVEPVWPRTRTLGAMLIVAVAYYVGVRVGLDLTMRPNPVSTMWPPNAILTAALLLTPARAWWTVVLAALPAHLAGELSEGIPLTMVLCWFISNASEALIGAGAARLLEPVPRVDSFRRVTVFLVSCVFFAPFASSFLDAAFVAWNRFGTAGYWEVWRTRFFSNALATLALVPVILQTATARLDRLRDVPPRRYVEAGALTLGLLAAITGTGAAGQAPAVNAPIQRVPGRIANPAHRGERVLSTLFFAGPPNPSKLGSGTVPSPSIVPAISRHCRLI